jgi:hypothetical protein
MPLTTFFNQNSSRYKNDWIRVERTREQHTLDLHMGIPWETVTMTALGRNKKMFKEMLEEGMRNLKLGRITFYDIVFLNFFLLFFFFFFFLLLTKLGCWH